MNSNAGKNSRMPRWILLAAAMHLAGCTPAPVVVTENPPHYVIVQQDLSAVEKVLGAIDTDAAVRVGADDAADARCRAYGRVAKLPAHSVSCISRHWLYRDCIAFQYTYECIASHGN